MKPRYRGKRLIGGRPPSQRPASAELDAIWIEEAGNIPELAKPKEEEMPKREDVPKIDQPWLSGEPYYCAVCGATKDEMGDCDEFANVSPPECRMESKEQALERKVKHERN